MGSKDRLGEFPNPFKDIIKADATKVDPEIILSGPLSGLISSPADPDFNDFMEYIGQPKLCHSGHRTGKSS